MLKIYFNLQSCSNQYFCFSCVVKCDQGASRAQRGNQATLFEKQDSMGSFGSDNSSI